MTWFRPKRQVAYAVPIPVLQADACILRQRGHLHSPAAGEERGCPSGATADPAPPPGQDRISTIRAWHTSQRRKRHLRPSGSPLGVVMRTALGRLCALIMACETWSSSWKMCRTPVSAAFDGGSRRLALASCALQTAHVFQFAKASRQPPCCLQSKATGTAGNRLAPIGGG